LRPTILSLTTFPRVPSMIATTISVTENQYGSSVSDEKPYLSKLLFAIAWDILLHFYSSSSQK
jgi:hypothetical protein